MATPANVLITTTPGVDGYKVQQYMGVVTGEAILGANIFRDMFAGFRDIIGGRAGAYEAELRKARDIALDEMADEATKRGANAVVGVDIDYETIQINGGGSMLMVTASGTAVKV